MSSLTWALFSTRLMSLYCCSPLVSEAHGEVVHGAQHFHDLGRAQVVLFELHVVGDVEHQARRLHVGLRESVAHEVHDAGRPLVGVLADGHEVAGAALVQLVQRAGDHQGARVGHRVPHAADAAVLDDVVVQEQLHDGLGVVLAEHVGLAQVQEDVVAPGGLVPGVAGDGVGLGQGALAVDDPGLGPLPREVEEDAGPGELAQLDGAQVPLQLVEDQGAHAPNVHPGAQVGYGDGVLELRSVVQDFESAYSHGHIVPDGPR